MKLAVCTFWRRVALSDQFFWSSACLSEADDIRRVEMHLLCSDPLLFHLRIQYKNSSSLCLRDSPLFFSQNMRNRLESLECLEWDGLGHVADFLSSGFQRP